VTFKYTLNKTESNKEYGYVYCLIVQLYLSMNCYGNTQGYGYIEHSYYRSN